MYRRPGRHGLIQHRYRLKIIGNISPTAQKGAQLFHDKACIYCHKIGDSGGIHGPDLTDVGNRLNSDQLTLKIVNGGKIMPAFGGTLSKEELNELVTFLQTRKGTEKNN